MGARFLDDAARSAFAAAVEDIETQSSIEVVIAVRRRSARYLHANLIVGAVAAFAALAVMLFADATFGLYAILFDPFAVGIAAGALVELLPGIKRLLTPRPVRRRVVAHAAHATFVERGVHNTVDRSGLLVYISWLEQEVALVADWNLEKAWTPAGLRAAEDRMTAAMHRGGAAVAKVLADAGAQVAPRMPRREGDLDELPNEIDSDLAGKARA